MLVKQKVCFKNVKDGNKINFKMDKANLDDILDSDGDSYPDLESEETSVSAVASGRILNRSRYKLESEYTKEELTQI